ncbi:MAG: PEGA domain-containing protein, partial [Planctomycetota bacterium]
INAVLLLNTGSVIIKSDPVDAKALIDGNEVGNTPVTITDLKPGMQTVEIKMEGYENWSESVEIIPGNEIVIAAALQMKTGSVCINSCYHNRTGIGYLQCGSKNRRVRRLETKFRCYSRQRDHHRCKTSN